MIGVIVGPCRIECCADASRYIRTIKNLNAGIGQAGNCLLMECFFAATLEFVHVRISTITSRFYKSLLAGRYVVPSVAILDRPSPRHPHKSIISHVLRGRVPVVRTVFNID